MEAPTEQELRFAVLAEKEGYDQPLFSHNLVLTRLYEDIIVPYDDDKPFFIDGVPVKKDTLRRIKITRQTDRFAALFAQLHERVRWNHRNAGVFIPIADYPGRLDALFRESGIDVTGQLIDAFREKKKFKVPLPEIIAAASQVVAAGIKSGTG